MKRNLLVSIAIIIATACGKGVDDPGNTPGGNENVFVRNYTQADASIEQIDGCPSIVWDKGDSFILMTGAGKEEVTLLTPEYLSSIPEGEHIDVIMVNPSRNGRFAGFDGYNEVKNRMSLSSLYPSEEKRDENMEAIRTMANSLSGNPDHIFTLARSSDGWLLVHKQSGKGFTEYKDNSSESGSGAIRACIWSPGASTVTFENASAFENSTNIAKGREEAIYIMKDGMYLWSGGHSDPTSWFEGDELPTFCNWLLYNVPANGLEYGLNDGSEGKMDSRFTGESYASAKIYYAVYPYDGTVVSDGESIHMNISSAQTFKNGAYAHSNFPAIGTLDNKAGKVSFRNLGGALCIPVKGSGCVQSISVRDASGAAICGPASLKVSSIADGSYELNFDGGLDEVTLDCNAHGGVALSTGKESEFIIALPAGSLSKGVEISIRTTDGVFSRTLSGTGSIKRGATTRTATIDLGTMSGSIPELRLENPIVAEYIDNVSYVSVEDQVFTKECKSRFVSDFKDRVLVCASKYRTDQPSSISITWPGAGSAKVNVQLAIDGNWADAVRDTLVDAASESFSLVNMLPGKYYCYRVLDGKGGKELSSGEFNTTGTLRMIAAEGSWNIRDLGGLVSTTYGNRPLRYEWIYRGGSLNEASPAARTELQQIGIKAELDLRGALNPTDGQDKGASANINDIGTYTFGYSMVYGADFRQIMTDYAVVTGYHPYPAIYANALVKDMAWIIYELRKSEPHPVYFHCKLGADRTTAVAYMVEALLGVRPADIARDHELTSFARDNGGFLTRYVTGNDVQHECFMHQLEVPEGCDDLAQKIYWYFNNQFEGCRINADDLDWFICNMLQMSADELKAYQKDWAFTPRNWETTLTDVYETPTTNW